MKKMANKLQWSYPGKNILFMKIETFVISIITALIIFFSLVATGSFIFTMLITLLFLGIYIFVAYFSKIIFLLEHKYHLTPTHLEIVKKNRFGTKKEKVHLKKIHTHKLDKFFLGGYALSHKGKHLLYFNNKKELEKFVKHIKRHGKKK